MKESGWKTKCRGKEYFQQVSMDIFIKESFNQTYFLEQEHLSGPVEASKSEKWLKMNYFITLLNRIQNWK